MNSTIKINTKIVIATSVLLLTLLAALLIGIYSVQGQTVLLTSQLEIGMSGSQVTTLQQYLAANPSIYPEGLVTGYFGPLTQAAVMRFQTAHEIPQVGRVGPMTLAKINSLAVGGGVVGGTGSIGGLYLSGITVATTTNNSLMLTVGTNLSSQVTVFYDTKPLTTIEGANPAISGVFVQNGKPGTIHTITLTSLLSKTKYYYIVKATNDLNDVTVSAQATLTTN